MNRLLPFSVVLFFLCSCATENPFVEVTVKNIHVPVLKNLKENPVLQMKLQINDSLTTLHSTTITVNLEGTSEMADIKLVRVWYSGNDSLFGNVSDMNLSGFGVKQTSQFLIATSTDDGKTWPEENWLLLDEGKSYGYSCLTSVDENTIGFLYEGSRAHMTFESIPLPELLRPGLNK